MLTKISTSPSSSTVSLRHRPLGYYIECRLETAVKKKAKHMEIFTALHISIHTHTHTYTRIHTNSFFCLGFCFCRTRIAILSDEIWIIEFITACRVVTASSFEYWWKFPVKLEFDHRIAIMIVGDCMVKLVMPVIKGKWLLFCSNV